MTVPVLAGPNLKALSGWKAGEWQGGQSSSHRVCTSTPDTLLLGGRPGRACSFTVIKDEQANAAVTYQCPGGRQGRTEVRRDTNNLYVVDAQGLEKGLPFAERSEWRRLKSC